MRHHTSHTPHPRGRPATWRRAVMLAVIAGTAVLAAACGGAAAAPPAHLTAYQRALGYAECMRAHGDPGFPDPQNDGTFNSTTANRGAFNGTVFLSANKTCAHLEGPGITPAQQEQSTLQALKFAACMRAHGITGFQYSPPHNGSPAQLGAPAGSAGAGDLGSPQFQSAQQACRELMPSGGGS
ncbi:MAG: hypothetical protein ACRDNO_31485 [Trebonia sp.]